MRRRCLRRLLSDMRGTYAFSPMRKWMQRMMWHLPIVRPLHANCSGIHPSQNWDLRLAEIEYCREFWILYLGVALTGRLNHWALLLIGIIGPITLAVNFPELHLLLALRASSASTYLDVHNSSQTWNITLFFERSGTWLVASYSPSDILWCFGIRGSVELDSFILYT